MFSRPLDIAAEFVRGVKGPGFPFAKATILTGFGLIGCWQEFAKSIGCYPRPEFARTRQSDIAWANQELERLGVVPTVD